jgi:hypothetical protein
MWGKISPCHKSFRGVSSKIDTTWPEQLLILALSSNRTDLYVEWLVEAKFEQWYCGVFSLSKNCGARDSAVAMERLGRYVSAEMNSCNRRAVFCMWSSLRPLLCSGAVKSQTVDRLFCIRSLQSGYIESVKGDGVRYLHHDPRSHRRRRKWKSQIWDSKIL